MRLSRTLALGASVLVLVSACTTGGGSSPAQSVATAGTSPSPAASPSPPPTIKIGSVGFYEALGSPQVLLVRHISVFDQLQNQLLPRKLGHDA